jgi:hypothetical protein
MSIALLFNFCTAIATRMVVLVGGQAWVPEAAGDGARARARPAGQGTGFALSAAYRMARARNGTIHVLYAARCGTNFPVFVPILS